MQKLYFSLVMAIFTVGISSKALSEADAQNKEDRYAPMRLGMPESIGGYPIVAVQTDNNFVCMNPGEKRLVIQSSQPTIEDALRAFPKERIKEDLQALNLIDTAQWEWDIVGPGATREQLLSQFEQSYGFFKAHGCASLRSPSVELASAASDKCPPPAKGQRGGEVKCTTPHRGFAIMQNRDDALGKVGTNAQSVILVAPTVGNNQRGGVPYSAFLNNGTTNKDYGLQVGFIFRRGRLLQPAHGEVVWADTSVKLIAKPFSILPYVAGHAYYTTISFTSGIWWMCAADTENPATYMCAKGGGTSDQGTYLKKSIAGTGIFAENCNTNSDWHTGFGNPWLAYEAKIYVDGKPHAWSSEDAWTLDACKAGWPPKKGIVGSIAKDGVVKFLTSGIPTCCGCKRGVSIGVACDW